MKDTDFPMAIFIDCSAMKDIFNGENKGKSKELLGKLKEMNDSGVKIKVVTSMSNFLRAIWLSNPEAKIQDIQKTLSFLDIGFSIADFKNEKDVLEETIKIVQSISGDTNGRQ